MTLEILKYFFLPSKKNKTPGTQSNTTRKMTVKLNKNNGLHTPWTRTPVSKSVFAAIAGEVANRRFTLLRNFPDKSGQVVLSGQDPVCAGLILYCT
jgi:hypothetical protein